MAIYKMVCDNGQIIQTELNMKATQNEIDAGWKAPTLEAEISKLESFFAQLAADKKATGTHPSGWLDPLPSSIVTYRELAVDEKIAIGSKEIVEDTLATKVLKTG